MVQETISLTALGPGRMELTDASHILFWVLKKTLTRAELLLIELDTWSIVKAAMDFEGYCGNETI